MGICTILQKNNWRLSQYLAIVINKYTWNLDNIHMVFYMFSEFFEPTLSPFIYYGFILVWPWRLFQNISRLINIILKTSTLMTLEKCQTLLNMRLLTKVLKTS